MYTVHMESRWNFSSGLFPVNEKHLDHYFLGCIAKHGSVQTQPISVVYPAKWMIDPFALKFYFLYYNIMLVGISASS